MGRSEEEFFNGTTSKILKMIEIRGNINKSNKNNENNIKKVESMRAFLS